MLPQKQRVPRKMFPLLSSKGVKIFSNNLLILRFISKEDGLNSRFCFSVSKKVSKSAVVRNRLRRAGYRFLKEYIPKIDSKIVAVFSFKKVSKNNEDIAESLKLILKESKLIK